MERHADMKKIIASLHGYLRNRTDPNSITFLQSQLQMLASTTEISKFEPESSITTEFYVRLHEVMAGLESGSTLIWSAIAVLQHACANANAKYALIHTYRFMPILTRYLATHNTADKQLRLLEVLVELTYGVKVSWQEAHLPGLISCLVQIIMEGENVVKSYALAVLVNLSYKNLPVLYVLMRKVEITKFIKNITKLNDNPSIRMQVCKMLIILEQMRGTLPDADILNFVDVAFSTVSTAFQSKDSFMLRHMVDFFKDVRENGHFGEVMLKYRRYREDTRKLVKLVEVEKGTDAASQECISSVLEFLSYLLNVSVDGIDTLLPTLVAAALRWLHNDVTCIQSLLVLQGVVEQTRNHSHPEVKDEVMEQLKPGLRTLLQIIAAGVDAPIHSREQRQKLTCVVTLLAEMSNFPDLRKEMLMSIKHDAIGGIFEGLLQQPDHYEESLFQGDVSELCIQALSLVASLAAFSSDWMSAYVMLLTQRHIQVAMAVALHSGRKKIAMQVFALLGSAGWTKDSTNKLCDAMTQLQPAVPTSLHPTRVMAAQAHTPQQDLPLYTCIQESRLNELIANLQLANEQNKIGDVATSAVMELYEFKLAAMGDSVKMMQTSLEAADAYCTGMHHQLAQYQAEMSRLHQMLFYKQQCIEGTTQEKKDLMNKLQELTEQLANEKKNLSAEVKDLKKRNSQLEVVVRQKDTELESRMAELASEMAKLKQVELRLAEAEARNLDLVKQGGVLEETLGKCKTQVTDCEAKISELNSENNGLRHSLAESIEIRGQRESLIAEKDKALTEMKKKVTDLERIREIVINVAGGKISELT